MYRETWENGLGYDVVGPHGDEDVIFAEVLDDPVQSVVRIRNDEKYLEIPRKVKILDTEVPLPHDFSPETILYLLETQGEEID
jgi:hypothetical protein